MIKAKCIFMQLQSSGEKLGEAPQNHFQSAGAAILTEQGGLVAAAAVVVVWVPCKHERETANVIMSVWESGSET